MTDQIRVLCVDDDPRAADLAARQLVTKGDGIDAVTATSVADGLSVLSEQSIDCVVSDYEMPERNGLEFLRELRDRGLDVPFILFTARGLDSVDREAITPDLTAFLRKGRADRYETLVDRIESAIGDGHDDGPG
jgi:CheY-like chemotaxis protein